MVAAFARIKIQTTFAYWRLKRGCRNNTTKIATVIRRNPGVSLEKITDCLYSFIPLDSRRKFDRHIAPTLDLLARYRVIEDRAGWRLTDTPDPFAKLVETTSDESQLVEAFGELAVYYSGTIERRLVAAIATFLVDNTRSYDMRRFAYLHFLSVIGIPANQWPEPAVLMNLAVPTDFDWSILNAFLPKSARRTIA